MRFSKVETITKFYVSFFSFLSVNLKSEAEMKNVMFCEVTKIKQRNTC